MCVFLFPRPDSVLLPGDRRGKSWMETPVLLPSPPPLPGSRAHSSRAHLCLGWGRKPSQGSAGVGGGGRWGGKRKEEGEGRRREGSHRGAARVVILSFWLPGRAFCTFQERTGKCLLLSHTLTLSLLHSLSSFLECKRTTCSLGEKKWRN